MLHMVLLPLASCAHWHPFAGGGGVGGSYGEYFVNYLFVLLIKREACPHNVHLPFPKMRNVCS
jgi:hypothetical protein